LKVWSREVEKVAMEKLRYQNTHCGEGGSRRTGVGATPAASRAFKEICKMTKPLR